MDKIPSHSPVVLQKKSKLSKKEYREIDIELRKYFYFDSNAVDVRNLNNSILVYHSLNEKDKMRCVFLLRKGGYDISTIETFLVKAQVLDFNDLNFLELYKNEYVFIFELFCEECNLVEELVEANEIVNILSSLAGDSDEFFEWNEELKRLASEMFEKISQNQKKDYIKKKIKDYEKVENWK